MTLTGAYPLNTVIVTSRIVGYELPFRFEGKEFAHLKMARLRLPEIKTFVENWYAERVENESDRAANVSDLVRIIGESEHSAIRDLAENPLLLTIIALVHRIDAVLPDERVVLYQKCTETLLNTWEKWKEHSHHDKYRSRIERRNRNRLEAIAHWMHCRAGGERRADRAIAPYKEVSQFLVSHIARHERYRDVTEDAEDQAEDFLQFVKRRAGLLIEVGRWPIQLRTSDISGIPDFHLSRRTKRTRGRAKALGRP